MSSKRIASSPCKPQPLFVCIKLWSLHLSCSCHWDRQASQPYLEGGRLQVNFTAHHPPAKPSWPTYRTSASDEITCCLTILLQNLALHVTSTTDRLENLLQPEQQQTTSQDFGASLQAPSTPCSSVCLQPCQRLTQAAQQPPREWEEAQADRYLPTHH